MTFGSITYGLLAYCEEDNDRCRWWGGNVVYDVRVLRAVQGVS